MKLDDPVSGELRRTFPLGPGSSAFFLDGTWMAGTGTDETLPGVGTTLISSHNLRRTVPRPAPLKSAIDVYRRHWQSMS